jgi:hypothetical protein
MARIETRGGECGRDWNGLRSCVIARSSPPARALLLAACERGGGGAPPRTVYLARCLRDGRELDLSGGVTWRWDHARGHRPTGSRCGAQLTCTRARRINPRARRASDGPGRVVACPQLPDARAPARILVKFATHS